MLKRSESYKQQNKISESFYRSFWFKLLVFVGVAMILLMSINTWYTIHIQEQQLKDEILIAMNNIAQTVKYSTRTNMLENKKEKVQEIISYIAGRNKGIERIRVFDKKGKIKSTTKLEERGRIVEKTADQCVVCHMSDEPCEEIENKRRIRIAQSESGNYRVVSFTHAIYNEESCYIQCHEYHSERQKVLGIFEVTMSLKDVDAKIASNRRHLIQFSIMLFLIIMSSIGAMLFYYLIRPVHALLNGIWNVSLGDNSKTEIPLYSKDEFGQLAQSLNNMFVKIRKEIAYRNLLLYDNIIPKQQEDETPLRSIEEADTNEHSGLGSTFEEIYERIQDETHMKLVRSVKLASLGQLSAGIAHEINNPLTAVLSYSSLLLEKAQGSKEKQWLNIIVDETKRCRNIVAGLLEFARLSTPEKVSTQVNDIVNRAISLVENKESFHNIKMIKKLDPNLPRVRVDRGQIYQVLTNLIINAGDSMDGRGTLTVQSQPFTIESKVTNDRNFVEISITDTGCGIPEQNMERLFDPFFTTKGPTVGTGLGLSICFGIIKRHGGNITVHSKIKEGSTFIIHLPIEMENENGQYQAAYN
jgi:two-component system NtrC family sensor kinase